MKNVNVIAAMLRAELFHEIKAFVGLRPKRCPAGDPRWGVTPATLMTQKLKYPILSLDRLEMLAAWCGNSAAGADFWMSQASPALAGGRPVELLASADGARRVEREIERIFRRSAQPATRT